MSFKLWSLLGAESCIGLLAVVTFTLMAPERISETNFRRIGAGLGETRVYSILGQPGDYRDEKSSSAFLSGREETWALGAGDREHLRFWLTNEMSIFISFDDRMCVMGGFMVNARPQEKFHLERLGTWILSGFQDPIQKVRE